MALPSGITVVPNHYIISIATSRIPTTVSGTPTVITTKLTTSIYVPCQTWRVEEVEQTFSLPDPILSSYTQVIATQTRSSLVTDGAQITGLPNVCPQAAEDLETEAPVIEEQKEGSAVSGRGVSRAMWIGIIGMGLLQVLAT